MWQSIFRHDELDLILVVYVDDFKMAGPKKRTWPRAGPVFARLSIWASQSPMTGTLGACTLKRTASNYPSAHIHLRMCLTRSAQAHAPRRFTERMISGSMIQTIKHGRAIAYSQVRSSSSRGMKGASLTVQSSLKGQQCSMQQ